METYVLNIGGGKRRGIPIACAQSFVGFWRSWAHADEHAVPVRTVKLYRAK